MKHIAILHITNRRK